MIEKLFSRSLGSKFCSIKQFVKKKLRFLCMLHKTGTNNKLIIVLFEKTTHDQCLTYKHAMPMERRKCTTP